MRTIVKIAVLLLVAGNLQMFAQSGSGELLPEILRCKPVDQEQLVDPYTGNFSYSIPLVSIPSKNGAFPITLGYASGVKAHEEASYVGLGWSLNPGHIMRTVRAMPDDFEGTGYRYVYDYPDQWMYGARVTAVSYNGSYDCGTNSFTHQVGLQITDNVGVHVGRDQGGMYAGAGVNIGQAHLGARVGGDRGLEGSMSILGTSASLSSKGGMGVGGTLTGMAADPGRYLSDQGVATAAIALQQMTSSALTDGIASWYVWFSNNRTDESGNVYGTYRQDLNTQIFQVEPKYGDFYDKVGYRHTTGHYYSGGMANDMYAVYAQGLSGAMTLVNEPFQGHTSFRFLGDLGVDYANNNPNGGTKNTKYHSSKRIQAYMPANKTQGMGRIRSFIITKEDGIQYVFGQPVYTKYMKGPNGHMLTHDKVLSNDGSGDVEIQNYYYTSGGNTNGYAVAWLLTAILHPDYKPSSTAEARENNSKEGTGNANGIREDLIPDSDAKGNWVKFSYGLYDDFYLCNTNYENSMLHDAASETQKESYNGKGTGPEGKTSTWNRVAKQQVFVRSAETNTHTCVFRYSEPGIRTDGYESVSSTYTKIGDIDNTPQNPPRLEEILLFRNEDVNKPSNPYSWGQQYTYNEADAVLAWTFLYEDVPERQLCRGIPNSDNNADGKLDAADLEANSRGKLTLKGLKMYGVGKRMALPPYRFEYDNGAMWGKHKFDRWGTYKQNGTQYNHLSAYGEQADKDASRFNLTRICRPTGGSIEIDYESKKYLKVGKFDLVQVKPRETETHLAYSNSEKSEFELRGIWFDCGKGSDQVEFFTSTPIIDVNKYVQAKTDRVTVRVKYSRYSSWPEKTRWYVQFNRGNGSELGEATKYSTHVEYSFSVDVTKSPSVTVKGAAKFRSCWKSDKADAWAAGLRVEVIVDPGKNATFGEVTTTNPKCGGGPRVKELVYNSTLGKFVRKKYEYVNWNNLYSSGVATLEPPPMTKDHNDIVEEFDDIRNFYKPGPAIGHTHVTVTTEGAGQTKYEFHGPGTSTGEHEYQKNNLHILPFDDVPDQHEFKTDKVLVSEDGELENYDLSGQTVGTLELYKYAVPILLVDRSAFWGKPIMTASLDENGDAVQTTRYKYREGFEYGISPADRTPFQRNALMGVGESNEWDLEQKENYFVSSMGPMHAVVNGAPFTLFRSVHGTNELREELRKHYIFIKSATFKNSLNMLAAGRYVINLKKDYALAYLFKYNVQPVVESVTHSKDNVDRHIKNRIWDSKTGTILETKTQNDGVAEVPIARTTPAYHLYEGMEDVNQLSQVCQETKYVNNLSNESVATSSVTAWKETPHLVWSRHMELAWRTPMHEGKAAPLVPFPFQSPGTATDAWSRQLTFQSYDAWAHELVTIDAAGTPTRNVYGHHSSVVTGVIRNAYLEESGVYTCDYDNGDALEFAPDIVRYNHLDGTNGWERDLLSNDDQSISVTAEGENPFGEKCLKVVNASGASCNFRIDPSKDYVLSAWVRKTADGGTASLSADYRRLSPEDDGKFPFMVMGPFDANQRDNYREVSSSPLLVPSPSTSGGEKWEHYELRVPAKADLKGENGWYARVRVGAPDGGTVYITDIRFHPVNALAKTTFYSSSQRLPLVTLDENANPGEKTTYDDLGRPTKWEKRFASKWKHIKQREYDVIGCDYPQLKILTPANGATGVRITEDGEVTFVWEVDDNGASITTRTYTVYVDYGGYERPEDLVETGVITDADGKVRNSIKIDGFEEGKRYRWYVVLNDEFASEIGTFETEDTKHVKVRFVSAEKGMPLPLGDGKSWETAYLDLQHALTEARSNPGLIEEIWVAAGTYSPGRTADATFHIPPNVSVYGGFSGNEELLSERNLSEGVYSSVLNGDIDDDNEYDINGYADWHYGDSWENADNAHIVTFSDNAKLDGFMISKGGTIPMYLSPNDCPYGGGAYIVGSKGVKISNCKFFRNFSYSGAAVYACSGAEVEFSRCVFEENMDINDGNTTEHCHSERAGGIACENADLIVSHSQFLSNRGRAIHILGDGNQARIFNTLFAGNTSDEYSQHCIRVWGAEATLENVTIADNLRGLRPRSNGRIMVINSIVEGHLDASDGSIVLENTCYEENTAGNVETNDGCITVSPEFEAQGYYLKPHSPCLDKGNSHAADVGLDSYTTQLSGKRDDGLVDLGYHHE